MADGDKTACVKPGSLNSGKNDGPATCTANQDNRVFRGNPINVGTGQKSQVEIDYRSATGLEFKRFYASAVAHGTPQQAVFGGTGWRMSWHSSILASSSPPPDIYPRTLPLSKTVYRVRWWDWSYAIKNHAYMTRTDGQTYSYSYNGWWRADADVNSQLVNQGTLGDITGWTYTTEDQSVEQYNAVGQLISITNRIGLTQTLTYSDGTDGVASGNGGFVLDAIGTATAAILPAGQLIRVTDAYGSSLNFGYDVTSRIVKMTAPDNGVYLYSYDANSNLTSVTYPDSTTKQYLYENPSFIHALTGIIDENNSRYATYAYDSSGRAISTEHGNSTDATGADKISITYNADGTSSITDALGTTRNQLFETVLGVVKGGGTDQPAGSGCGPAVSNQTYDANGNVATSTDFNGNVTNYVYDLTRNLQISRTEAFGATEERTITTEWHATLRLPTVVAEPLRITSFIYNGDGGVTCGMMADGITPVAGVLCSQSIQATTDTTGALGTAATPTGTPRESSYTYNTAGQVLTVDGPRTDITTDITTYTYDAQGNLDSVTNALSQATTLSDYDANGRPGSITDPNGLVTSLYYDSRGRLTDRTVGSETTTYAYDGVGQLDTVTTPSGAVYTYSYDAAHRLTDIADNLGNNIHYTLDAMGNRTTEAINDAVSTIVQTHSRQFDALNRLWKDIGAVNQTTTFEYDANGNLTSVTDPLNRQTIQGYDALNRLHSSTDAANGFTSYGYDGLNQLVDVVDPNNLLTQYQRDGLGNLNQQISPDTGTTTNTYDEAGNLKTSLDAKGQLATYSYDELNRLTGISYTGGIAPAQTISYVYDQVSPTNYGLGRLTGITDVTGTISYRYDLYGRLNDETHVMQGASYTTSYGYDAQGRMNQITYPSARTVDYSFDTLGRISQIATTFDGNTQILASNISYQPFGGVNSFTFGDGQTPPVQTYTRQRDQDGRTASYTLNGNTVAIGYDPASQINSIIGDPLNPASFSYDVLGRLTYHNQGIYNQQYSYDANSNRLSQTLGDTTSYTYTSGSNRLESIQLGNSTPQPVTQDANGATTNDGTRQYSYDIRGRLIQSTTTQGTVNYEVNALGLRVRKHDANTDSLYHYDAQGHLIAESPPGSAEYTREYIYLGDQPVAVMQ